MSETALAGGTLARLHELVAAEGEAIAPALAAAPGSDVLGPLAIAAAAEDRDGKEYALIVEGVLEGYLLHFGRTRLLDTDDQDLRLLAGDYMYALGLHRLAHLGDLFAVRALADLITLTARHHADGRAGGEQLDGLWVLTALALAGGHWGGYEAAIARARQAPGERNEVLAAVGSRSAAVGVELEAQHALIAFHEVAAAPPPT